MFTNPSLFVSDLFLLAFLLVLMGMMIMIKKSEDDSDDE